MQGHSIAEVSGMRRIKEGTVSDYLAEVIQAGHPYCWPLQGLEEDHCTEIMEAIDNTLKTAGEFLRKILTFIQLAVWDLSRI